MLLSSPTPSWTRLVLAGALAHLLGAPSAAASYAPGSQQHAGTAVDQAKRFAPSTGFMQRCALQCPGYNFDQFSKTYAVPMAGVENADTGNTVCSYPYSVTPAQGDPVQHNPQCSYTAAGAFITGSGDTGCALQARFLDSCDPAVSLRRRRALSPLERKIQARQWQPQRQAQAGVAAR